MQIKYLLYDTINSPPITVRNLRLVFRDSKKVPDSNIFTVYWDHLAVGKLSSLFSYWLKKNNVKVTATFSRKNKEKFDLSPLFKLINFMAYSYTLLWGLDRKKERQSWREISFMYKCNVPKWHYFIFY